MRYYTTHKKEEEEKEEEIGGKGSESDGKREAEMPSYVSVCVRRRRKGCRRNGASGLRLFCCAAWDATYAMRLYGVRCRYPTRPRPYIRTAECPPRLSVFSRWTPWDREREKEGGGHSQTRPPVLSQFWQ